MHKYIYALWVLILILIPLTAKAGEESQLRFYNAEAGQYIDAPGIASEIRSEINGNIARTHVVQYFFNNTEGWQEGVYTYPLPDDAAVDKLVMIVDERRILGFVAEKEKARKIYEDAKKEGKAAGLVEQHRTNVFRTSVANVPPKSLVAIEIAYQHEMKIDDDRVSFRLPMAITPRFDNFDLRDFITLAASKAEDTKTHEVAERLALFDFEDGHNPVNLEVKLSPGFTPEKIKSRSHDVQVSDLGGGRYKIRTDKNILPGEQDFQLEWGVPQTRDALTFMHEENIDGAHYTHLMMLPPQDAPADTPSPKRQVTLIIDTSGSMDGPSIKQAKSALREAIYDLEAQDFFNVIEFNDVTKSLFKGSRSVTPENIKQALRFVDKLEAGGGTQMMPSVEMALAEDEKDGYLRQVVFITDGAIGYESDMGAYIRDHVGDARFFAVGIGAAPNAHLMRTFAMMGRGTFTFIGDVKETQEKMAGLFRKMKTPVLTDMRLEFDGMADAEIVPAKLPDLMVGEPISVAIKSGKRISEIKLLARRGDERWLQTVQAGESQQAEGVGKIYARRKIQDIKFSDPGLQNPENKARITALGIDHQLTSDFTSLVAVDEIRLRPKNAILLTERYSPNLPKGWQLAEYDPRQAARDYEDFLKEKESQSADEVKNTLNLPQTSTDYVLRLMLGLVFMVMALTGFWRQRYTTI